MNILIMEKAQWDYISSDAQKEVMRMCHFVALHKSEVDQYEVVKDFAGGAVGMVSNTGLRELLRQNEERLHPRLF